MKKLIKEFFFVLLVVLFFWVFIAVINGEFFISYKNNKIDEVMLQCDDSGVIEELKNQMDKKYLLDFDIYLHSSKINSIKLVDNKYKSIYCSSIFYSTINENRTKHAVYYKITNFLTKFDISLVQIEELK